jgi:hypothetical protein
MRNSKEAASSFLGLRIEGAGDKVKFVKHSGEEVTHKEATDNVTKHRKELKALSSNTLGAVSSQREWYHLKFLGAWIEIAKVLEVDNEEPESDEPAVVATKPVTNNPSLFDDEQYRAITEVITSHHLFKIVDVSRTFAHTVNCVTCGELSVDHDQDFHVATMLYRAGFRKTT